jgi:hypothetical protein
MTKITKNKYDWKPGGKYLQLISLTNGLFTQYMEEKDQQPNKKR